MWFEKKSAPDWHESFVADVRHVFKAKALSFEQATEALRTADGRRLLDFDIRARRGYNYDGYPGRKREPSVLKVALGDPEHADVFLFYKSCSNNGFLREEALRALRGHHGRLVCAAALIRVEDWVPQVADISLRLLQDLAAIDTAVHFFEFLDLIAALRSRLRFKPHWAATLEPMLLLPKWRDARRAAILSGDAVARRLAHELIRRADADFANEALHIAIEDPSPLVALWALTKLDDSTDVALRQEALGAGMRSRLASVRSDALRRYCRAGYSDLRAILETALFDSAHSVRGVAAFQLNALFSESALVRWRRAFDEGNRGEAMVMALAEFGEAEDAPRLRSQLARDSGRIRALALRGIMRMGTVDSNELLQAALRDTSSHVVGAAIAVYSRGLDQLGQETLRQALAHARSAAMRARLISASRLLPKWDRLEFLLDLHGSCADTEFPPLAAAVQRWIGSANNSFMQPRPNQRLLIRHALENARSRHPATFWDQVVHLL